MAIPYKFNKENIIDAMNYIDINGVPERNQSTQYELISDSGKKYPPKYVIAVANHLVTGADITTDTYNSITAKNFIKGLGFVVETKQEKYELVITSNSVTSTDERFTMDNLGLGDDYKPLDSYFKSNQGDAIRRDYGKGERRNSNQTFPRLVCQVFESQIASLSIEEKENFPICQYSPAKEMIRGIFSSVDEFRKHRNSIEYLIYKYDNGRQFVIYCWSIFSTIAFSQECLKRFGKEGDQLVLVYREKVPKEEVQAAKEELPIEEQNQKFNGFMNPYSTQLVESNNIIFRGAPGTGKSYLAKEIAADIISNGYVNDYTLLTEEQKKQVEFIQFHPSYDYSDFVEGLRPVTNTDGSMGFELQDGVFTKFVKQAQINYENSQKTQETITKEATVQEMLTSYFLDIELGVDELKTLRGTSFYIVESDEKRIILSIPDNPVSNQLSLNVSDLQEMLESDQEFTQVRDVTTFFGKLHATQHYSYLLAIYNDIKSKHINVSEHVLESEKLKPYVFIIDEINRGEISKIFGELFFTIDPGYRGTAGEVSTQYANLHEHPDKKFFIPENVYIIGTMNDIDRSVDSFDFAMRRRFRFIEIKADERLEMLAGLNNDELEAEAIRRMTALNDEISNIEELNENYHIGASYFLKLKSLDFNQLWTDYLHPLLQDYIRGMYDEESIMMKFEKAYGDDYTTNQG